jgi:hypothetical protein
VTAVAVEDIDEVTAEANELTVLTGETQGDGGDLETYANARIMITVIIRFGFSE